MKIVAAAWSALLVAAVFGASPAGAFTDETLSKTGTEGGQRFTDPDEQAPLQQFTDPSTGASGYSWTSPHLKLSITRQPSDSSTPFPNPGRSPDGRSTFGFGRSPFGNGTP